MLTPDDVPELKARVRQLTTTYRAAGPDCFEAVRELVFLALNLTVLRRPGHIRLAYTQGNPDVRILGAVPGEAPLQLNNGAYLRVSAALMLVDIGDGVRRLKVRDSSFQYQLDPDGEEWVIRYDFLRNPRAPHPGAHVQIRGTLDEDCLPVGRPLSRIHIPTARIPIEAVIRMLVEQFQIACNEPATVWRPVFTESETLFHEIAHRPPYGPDV